MHNPDLQGSASKPTALPVGLGIPNNIGHILSEKPKAGGELGGMNTSIPDGNFVKAKPVRLNIHVLPEARLDACPDRVQVAFAARGCRI